MKQPCFCTKAQYKVTLEFVRENIRINIAMSTLCFVLSCFVSNITMVKGGATQEDKRATTSGILQCDFYDLMIL